MAKNVEVLLSTVYAKNAIAARVTLLEKSKTRERIWLVIHTELGPYL